MSEIDPRAMPRIETMSDDAASAWRTLCDALDVLRPSCRGDARFITDAPSRDLQAELAAVCAGCPLLEPCDAFADASDTYGTAGFWGGSYRGTGQRRRERAGAA
jgi:Transcription factor WhiB